MYYSFSFSTAEPYDPLYFDADDRLYGVGFAGANRRNTWVDWHLIPLQRPSIAPPDKKTKTIDVPGMNGDLDISESLTGYPVFANRKGSIEYMIETGHEYWNEIYNNMCSFLHGRKLYMAYEEEPEYYYYGTFTVEPYDSQKDNSNITINYDLKPYKQVFENGWDNFDIFDFEADNREGLTYNPVYRKEIYSNTDWIPIVVDSQFGNYTEKPVVPKFIIESRDNTSALDTEILIKFVNTELGIEIERTFKGTGEFTDPRIIFTQNRNHGKVFNYFYTGLGMTRGPIRYEDMYSTIVNHHMQVYAKGNGLISITAPAGRM